MKEQVSQLAGILANVTMTPEQETEIRRLLDELDKFAEERERLLDYNRELNEISKDVRRRRREWKMPVEFSEGEVTCVMDDVAFLLTDMNKRLQAAEDDAAAMRGLLEKITERGIDPDVDTEESRARRLDHLAFLAREGLANATGEKLRADIRRLEQMAEKWETNAREFGTGFYYDSDRTLATRIQRLVDHYNRTAANAVSGAKSFKDDMLTWLRAMAINAESATWAGTHAEKNARLRGLVEVIEAACKRVNEARVDGYRFGGGFQDWMKSDYPVREYLRTIHQLEYQIEQLKGNGQQQPVTDTPDWD